MRTYQKLEQIMKADIYLFDGLTPYREVIFKKWLPQNMKIYNAFISFAKKLKFARDRKYYSARAIWERLRWESLMQDSPEGEFKMSDLNMPFVSWLAMRAEPELRGMFKVKTRKKAFLLRRKEEIDDSKSKGR